MTDDLNPTPIEPTEAPVEPVVSPDAPAVEPMAPEAPVEPMTPAE